MKYPPAHFKCIHILMQSILKLKINIIKIVALLTF